MFALSRSSFCASESCMAIVRMAGFSCGEIYLHIFDRWRRKLQSKNSHNVFRRRTVFQEIKQVAQKLNAMQFQIQSKIIPICEVRERFYFAEHLTIFTGSHSQTFTSTWTQKHAHRNSPARFVMCAYVHNIYFLLITLIAC